MKPRYVIAAGIIGIIAIAIVLSVLVLDSTKEDFSTYNAEWNGASRIKDLSSQDHPVSEVFSLNDLSKKDRGVLVMLNPNHNVSMTEGDVASVRTFVENGGSLLLSADFGNANPLLDGLGLGQLVRFNQSLLLDDVNNWAGGAYPLINTLAPSNITADVHEVYFNYGTVLDVHNVSGYRAAILAKSSAASYISAAPDGSAALENGSTAKKGENPVLAYLDYGKGKVILFSDPSAFVNGMLNKGDNERLYNNIMTNLTRGDATTPVFFDESHRVQQPLLRLMYSAVTSSDAAKYAVVLCAMGILAIGIAASKVTRGRRLQRATPKANHNEPALNEGVIIDDITARNPRWSLPLFKELLNNVRLNQRRRP